MRRTIATIASAVVLAAGSSIATADTLDRGRYHGPDRMPRWLTTACEYEDSNNCYWDAGRGNGAGHSFWAIPVNRRQVAVVYWSRDYNRTHGYVTGR